MSRVSGAKHWAVHVCSAADLLTVRCLCGLAHRVACLQFTAENPAENSARTQTSENLFGSTSTSHVRTSHYSASKKFDLSPVKHVRAKAACSLGLQPGELVFEMSDRYKQLPAAAAAGTGTGTIATTSTSTRTTNHQPTM